MGVSPSYREYVTDQLSALGGVIVKRMFGGVGLYFDGRMFGLIDDDTVFLRVDDATRPDFAERGMEPFHPIRSNPKKVSQNYYQLPADVLEDNEQLVLWARRAIQASLSPTAAERGVRANARLSAKLRSPSLSIAERTRWINGTHAAARRHFAHTCTRGKQLHSQRQRSSH